MNKLKSYWAVAKVNFKHSTWIAYLIFGILALAMFGDIIMDAIIASGKDKAISAYCMLYGVCLLAPILIASINYSKLMNIGVKKKQYFFGCIINYAVIAAVVSILAIIEMYLIDRQLNASRRAVYGLIEVFGWDTNVFTAFFSQFAFLLMVQSAVHTLVFMQTKWYGWIADIAIVLILAVFLPIAPLRAAVVFFFNMTIFTTPIVQILVCLTLATLFYATNLYYLKKRV